MALFLFLGPLGSCHLSAAETFETEHLTIETSDGKIHPLTVEIADTEAKRELGLMYRQALDESRGMLFVFRSRQRIRMWMKNTFVPLDMIFLDQDLKVQSIVEHTVPMSETVIDSVNLVDFVLEVKAGTVKKLGLKKGDQAKRDGPLIGGNK